MLHPRNQGGWIYGIQVDRFSYETESAEKIFADNFCNPHNGPDSEDGADYDPEKDKTNFPSYKENVFYYTYDNVAIVVLNSDYWYAPSLKHQAFSDGNLHGYLMDMQIAWLEQTLKKLEDDPNIDHVFVTQHTPTFPNGGHVKDDMWYNGNNEPRAHVAGKGLKKGIIERRDEYLNLLVNESSKVRAILTGDEHNYARLPVNDDLPRYPENYKPSNVTMKLEIMQINNGAAGAPYYAQEETPWSDQVQYFSTENALVLIDVEGEKITVRVINPDTLSLFDEFVLVE
mgnify:CR=1 FL=1